MGFLVNGEADEMGDGRIEVSLGQCVHGGDGEEDWVEVAVGNAAAARI